MNETRQPAVDGSEQRNISDRGDAEGALARGQMYALFSDLISSPFDAEPAIAGSDFNISSLKLPYALTDFDALLTEWRDADSTELKREYSGLFEVGSDGPPVPIREDLHLNQPAGVREDIVRFYEFFGYTLAEKFAWSPDHLSIELEFMYFLSFQEAEGQGDTLSFQLAQYDFAERHLHNWIPSLADRALQQQPDGIYTRILAAMSEFIDTDLTWQAGTIKQGQAS